MEEKNELKMKILIKITKWILFILMIPAVYLLMAFLLTAITVNKKDNKTVSDKTIFLSTNGVHLDVVMPKKNIDTELLKGIKTTETEHYLSFGWGEENFYLNTPTWNDLTISTAFKALFLNSSTLVHITRYQQKQSVWVEIKITETELQHLNTYLQNTFKVDKNGNKILLQNKGYTAIDDFYTAEGNYTCLNTCNSWVNTGFKQSGIKCCYWTPFDFGLLNKYK